MPACAVRQVSMSRRLSRPVSCAKGIARYCSVHRILYVVNASDTWTSAKGALIWLDEISKNTL